jgi:hypothetical protein
VAKGAELFLAETSAAADGVPFSWLFLSWGKKSGFANDLVQGHLRKQMLMLVILKFDISTMSAQ